MTVKDKDDLPAPSAPPASMDPNSGRGFPDPFYCPITEKILEDPVVIPTGDSFERSAITERGDYPSNQLYSNRALNSIIDEAVELSGDSLRAGFKRFDKSVRSNFQLLLEKSALPSAEYHPLPEAYYCSITLNLMHDPVIDPDGNTYERVAIENWIRVNGKSPATRMPLTSDQLYPNHAISDLLNEEKNRSDDVIHPSIRRFKIETPPQRTDAEMGGSVASPATAADAAVGTTTATTTAAMPTTQAEIDSRRAQQTQVKRNFAGLCFAMILLIVFVPAGIYFAFALCLCILCFARNTDDDPY